MLRPPMPDLRSYFAEEREEPSANTRLEFIRTRELLRQLLPPAPARVLDVGGATGVHARWLAQVGYTVHAVGMVAGNVATEGLLPRVSAAVGDPRWLAEPDAHADATLLLGPLCRLIDRTDRVRALREAARVTVPGGLVAVAAITRHAQVLAVGARGLLGDTIEPVLREVLTTGRHDPRPGFTTAYLHRVEDLADEMREAGLHDVDVLGIEGPLAPVLLALEPEVATARLPAVLRATRLLDSDATLAAASPHVLGVARA